uniref:Peptidase M61 catalytic domain-containing protein n=1 Tax=Eiseniibacteriota bacterium TaxID=2212470 RepID=A0A832I2X5_UNCEI
MPSRTLAALAAALMLAALPPAHAAPAAAVRYALSVTAHDPASPPRVHVALEFSGEADGETELILPQAWGGEEHLWRVVRDLAVEGGGARLEPGADSARRVLRHAPGAALRVRYEVVQDRAGAPRATGRNPYRPVLQPGFVHLLGSTIFVRPGLDDATLVSFAADSVPAGWSFASDLEHAGPRHPLALGSLFECVIVAGDFRIVRRGPAGRGLRVALRGEWPFSDAEFADRLERIVRAHRAFWRERDEPFLVTVLPLAADPGVYSLGGTGLSDAFAFFATGATDAASMSRVLAHEHLHAWIPNRIGRLSEGANEAGDYWFSEGFTDFYTFRLLVRDGLWSLDDYARELNELLSRHARSPVREAPNARIASDFWSNADVRDLPYRRGFLLAMAWDHRLRAASGGRRDLDDVMLDLRRAWRQGRGRAAPLATEALAAALRRAGLDPTPDLERHIVRGEPMALPADVFGPGAPIETFQSSEYAPGFDVAATQAAQGVVAGVDPAGPAHAAGLRNGMRIVKRESGSPGNPDVELVYLVEDGGVERRIRYLPRGAQRFPTQRLALHPAGDTAARERVRRIAAGER